MTAFDDGYHAGLVNDRDNPHAPWLPAFYAWHLGNQTGLTVHCALVEAVYLSHPEE